MSGGMEMLPFLNGLSQLAWDSARLTSGATAAGILRSIEKLWLLIEGPMSDYDTVENVVAQVTR